MDFELMINSFPKLLNATVITLKLLSASLFFGLFIGLLFAVLRMNKNPVINKLSQTKNRVLLGTFNDIKKIQESFDEIEKLNFENLKLSKDE